MREQIVTKLSVVLPGNVWFRKQGAVLKEKEMHFELEQGVDAKAFLEFYLCGRTLIRAAISENVGSCSADAQRQWTKNGDKDWQLVGGKAL